MADLKKKVLIKLFGNYINAYSYIDQEKAAQKALDLFSTPRKGKLSSQDVSYLEQYQFNTHSYKFGNIRSYYRAGTGPSILLCHGWESNSARWRWLIDYLDNSTPNLEIIMLDAPAHGATDGIFFDGDRYARSIKEVANYYKPQIIIGHSVGAFATSLYLHDYAENQPEKVALLAPPDEIAEVTENYFEMLSYNDRVRETFQEAVLTRFPKPLEYYTTSDFMKGLNMEGILIHDREDDIHPMSDAHSINQQWLSGQLYETTGYGHSLQSEEVYGYIVEMIER